MARLPLILLALLAPPPAEPIDSIERLWAGFDPRALPLEIEAIKSWTEDGVQLESLYFTGEVFEGEKTRVFGYLARPERPAGRLPGILHIHGGGQTANLDWPRFWARRGYVCLSFDFCGNTNQPNLGPEYRRERYTLWGKVPADMMLVGGGTRMTPTPRHNPWFHWALAARRGLTLLESQPDVDSEKLGIFGVSVGGTLTWTVSGVDRRVKAAVPIYGCGFEFYRYPPRPEDPAPEELTLWRKLIAPEAHAARITCPILFLSATNDFHGKMDLAYRTLDLSPSPIRRQLFTPNYDHHVEPDEAASLPRWMDTHLKGALPPWPEAPRVEILGDGIPRVRVTPDRPDEVERVEIRYALNNDWPTSRFWRRVPPPVRAGDAFTGETPILHPGDLVIAFATVAYRSGAAVSSRLVKQQASALAGARATLERQALIDSMETAADWVWVPAYTDPNREGTAFFADWTGEGGERGFTLDPRMFPRERPMEFYFGTRKIGDPQFDGAGRAELLIEVLADQLPDSLAVRLDRRLPDADGTEYIAKLIPGGSPDAAPAAPSRWRTFRMTARQFEDRDHRPMPDWEHVERFILNGKSPAGMPPVFRRLRWAE